MNRQPVGNNEEPHPSTQEEGGGGFTRLVIRNLGGGGWHTYVHRCDWETHTDDCTVATSMYA